MKVTCALDLVLPLDSLVCVSTNTVMVKGWMEAKSACGAKRFFSSFVPKLRHASMFASHPKFVSGREVIN